MVLNQTNIIRLSLIVILLSLSGCFMHTYVGGFIYYPKGSDQNTAQYRLSIHIDGAKRHAFSDMTKKDIHISMRGKDDTVLLERQYTIQAANLNWDVAWERSDDLKIVFYEEQGLIKLNENNKLSYIPRQIFTLCFTLDPGSGKYIESFVPEHVTSNIFIRLEREKKKHIASLYIRTDHNNSSETLESLHRVAKRFDLAEKKTPGCMNCYASFVGDNIEMNAISFKESEKGNLVIEVIDWGKRELSKDVIASLKQAIRILGETE